MGQSIVFWIHLLAAARGVRHVPRPAPPRGDIGALAGPWGGRGAALALALFLMVVLPFWWNVLALVVTLVFGYVAVANIANWLGDAMGYRWGQRVLEKRWQEYVRGRDQTSSPL
jgi:hypothetical protein